MNKYPHDNSKGTFYCINCTELVADSTAGTNQRNHCPRCLWSMHVDFRTGDRSSACKSAMEPIAVWVKQKGEWAIIHRCTKCGALRLNRIAGDDNLSAFAVSGIQTNSIARVSA